MLEFAIDTEAFYHKKQGMDISSLGTYHYLRDPRADHYLMSVHNDEFEWVGHPKDFNWDLLHGAALVAHNMGYDGLVLERYRELGYFGPEIKFGPQHCTADLACYRAAPRTLAKASWGLLGVAVSKTVREKMDGKYFRDLSSDLKKEVVDYGAHDARIAWEIWKKWSPLWPEHEREVSRITREGGWRGVSLDHDRCTEYLSDLNEVCFDAESNIPWMEESEEKPLSSKFLAAYCRAQGIDVPESTAEDDERYEAWEEKYGAQFPIVGHLRTWRKANTLRKKLKVAINRIRPDNTMAVELKYFGAPATGRWSGAGKFNFQNLPKNPFPGKRHQIDLRSCITAPEGSTLVTADLSQIEPRCINWLCGNEALLGQVRDGYSVYEAHAIASKMWNGEKGTFKQNKELYALAKAHYLGLGYGMGWERFITTAKVQAGLTFTEVQSRKVVAEYRANNKKVVKLWENLEKDYKKSVRGDYTVELPSGRKINYFSVSALNYSFLKERGTDKRKKAWGGFICENITQATARDVMADMIVKIDQAGIPISFTVHDEIVCTVSEKEAKQAQAEIVRIMTTPPEWISDLPLGVESEITKRYKK